MRVRFVPPLQAGEPGYIPPGEKEDCPGVTSRQFIRSECTLDQGHTGPHAAHGVRNQLLTTWEEEDNEHC